MEPVIKLSAVVATASFGDPPVKKIAKRKSFQADGYYRDLQGRIMAPLLMFKRDNIEKVCLVYTLGVFKGKQTMFLSSFWPFKTMLFIQKLSNTSNGLLGSINKRVLSFKAFI